MRKVSEVEPQMWGPTIVGFGQREYDWRAAEARCWPWAFARSPRWCSTSSTPPARTTASRGLASTAWAEHLINKLADVDAGVLERWSPPPGPSRAALARLQVRHGLLDPPDPRIRRLGRLDRHGVQAFLR
jgi:hypothetical protein